MSLQSILSWLGLSPVGGAALAIFIASGFIEVSKIKLNPWSALIRWIGARINTDMKNELTELKKEITEIKKEQETVKKDVQSHIVTSHRNAVIRFATECMNHTKHTKSQFDYVFREYRNYEQYCEKNGIKNDEVKESIEYIRRIYRKCLDEGEFQLGE